MELFLRNWKLQKAETTLLEVFAVLEKDGTTLTSLGAKSDPVKCTVTPHEYEEKMEFGRKGSLARMYDL